MIHHTLLLKMHPMAHQLHFNEILFFFVLPLLILFLFLFIRPPLLPTCRTRRRSQRRSQTLSACRSPRRQCGCSCRSLPRRRHDIATPLPFIDPSSARVRSPPALSQLRSTMRPPHHRARLGLDPKDQPLPCGACKMSGHMWLSSCTILESAQRARMPSASCAPHSPFPEPFPSRSLGYRVAADVRLLRLALSVPQQAHARAPPVHHRHARPLPLLRAHQVRRQRRQEGWHRPRAPDRHEVVACSRITATAESRPKQL
jgi:hypothetical protein